MLFYRRRTQNGEGKMEIDEEGSEGRQMNISAMSPFKPTLSSDNGSQKKQK